MAAEQDRVVGPSHRGQRIVDWRRQRSAARSVDDRVEREADFVRLVQRHLHHPRGNLHHAGKASGRSEHERQPLRVHSAIPRYLLRKRRGWMAIGLQHEAGAVASVPVSKLLEQRLAGRERARRPRAERAELLRSIEAQAPARVLGGETCQHRLTRANLHLPRPGGKRRIRAQRRVAETSHADTGDEQPRVDTPLVVDARVDDGSSDLHAGDADAQRSRALLEPGDQRSRRRIHAWQRTHVVRRFRKRRDRGRARTRRESPGPRRDPRASFAPAILAGPGT